MKFKFLIFMLFLLALVIFTLENAEPITLNFLKGSVTASKSLILTCTLVLGILFGKVTGKKK